MHAVNVAAIYRVSTERQVRRDSDDGIPVQKHAIRAFIQQRTGWQLVCEYAEEGVSGFKVSADDRDVLQAALHDAKAGRWQVLVVFKADRLSRNAFEYPVVIDRFRRVGVEVWSVADAPGGKLLALDTQMDKFIRFLEGWQAETESKNTSIRVSEAMLQMARQGKWSGGRAPFGFRLNEARRPKSEAPALVIDAEQAAAVRLMADLYLDERLGCLQIARELNRRGVVNPTGRPWDDQKVRRVLQNPIIAGLPAFNRNQPSGGHFRRKNPYDLDQFILPRDEAGNLKPVPAYQIIPLERWLKLLNAMKGAKTPATSGVVQQYVTERRRGAEALLTGLVFCGHCGARLSADASPYRNRLKDGTVRHGRRVYYACQTHVHRGSQYCAGQRTYGCNKVESAVTNQLEQVLTMMDARELSERLAGGAQQGQEHLRTQVGALAAEIEKADRVVEGWLARMDMFLADPAGSPYTEAILARKIREARERRETLGENLKEVVARFPVPLATPAKIAELTELIPHWWRAFEEAPLAEKKVLLRDLVERINVRRDEVEIVFRVDLQSFLPKAREMAAAHAADARTVPPATWSR